jgi:putative transport protein
MLFHLPADLAAGVFAGAMTSTPALASAIESVGGDGGRVSVGYGIVYPFGTIGVVLFVQLLPRLLKFDLAGSAGSSRETSENQIQRTLVELTNPALVGRSLSELDLLESSGVQVTRVLRDNRLAPIPDNFVLALGQNLVLVGYKKFLPAMVDFFGRPGANDILIDVEQERMQIVVTAPAAIGKTLEELNVRHDFKVTLSRIERQEVQFMPNGQTTLQPTDVLFAVGEHANLQRFAAFAGHRAGAIDHTDILSLSIGIVLGAIVGIAPIGLPGGRSFSLGLAGGSLLVALMLGHFGRVGGVVGFVPRASRLLMSELGLIFFLADAGTKAGASLLPVLRQYGFTLVLAGLMVKSAAIAVGYLAARRWFKMDIPTSLGAICGGMTSTPGLGAITSKTENRDPVISYAATYPIALILMTLLAQAVVSIIRMLVQ